ncbi:MAG TPA: fumarylacetoacetate hydrolase family protein [Burkholderiales bacterium]|nr:fumarylacetoacetate hydrolase family protein [Burkholderiales bacterium]
MKLATLKDGTRDGTLLVVSKDLKRALKADHVAPTLQAALDDWEYSMPLLADLAAELEAGRAGRSFELDTRQLMAPLPRAYQFADGSAYLIHAELIRRSRKQEMPADAKREPLMYQGCSDPLLGPCDDIAAGSEAHEIDLEMELGVITGDVPMGVDKDKAAEAIRLLVLLNDVSLRALVPADLGKGFGFFHSKPPSSFAPVAVTPDELGAAWDGRRAHGPVRSWVNGELLGEPDAGTDMQFDFPRLIAHAAKTRPLGAGTIVGSGTVSNRDRAKGAGCLFERRAEEILKGGKAKTPFLKFGDRVRIEMLGPDGKSVFGAIDQGVVQAA